MGDSFPFAFGRYQLISRLAVGGMAEVFLAEAPGEHGFAKRLVIKRIMPQLVGDANFEAMFIDEAKLTARFVHPKIAQTYELGKVGDHLYIAMEWIDGIDVLALLREYAQRRRRIEPHIAVWIAHEILDALDYAHSLLDQNGKPLAVIHRDISPSNILMSVRGDIKLIDFGIARQKDTSRSHQTKSGTLKGKYGYMSPEQVVESPLDARSDVFSVGIVLAELLTGRRLFAAANELDVLLMVRDAKLGRLEKYGADIHPGLQAIVRKSLKKNLDERYASAGQFRDALSEWLFEQRIRMTPKLIADTVQEFKPALDLGRAPAEGLERAIPAAVADDGSSGPVISVSHDAVTPLVVPTLAPVAPAGAGAPARPVAAHVPAPASVVRPASTGTAPQTMLRSPERAAVLAGASATAPPLRVSTEAPMLPRTATPPAGRPDAARSATKAPPSAMIAPQRDARSAVSAAAPAAPTGGLATEPTASAGFAEALGSDIDLGLAMGSLEALDLGVVADARDDGDERVEALASEPELGARTNPDRRRPSLSVPNPIPTNAALSGLGATGARPGVARTSTAEVSARYPSIAAAVQSAAPQAPDPAMRDFDDLTIEPGRRQDVPLPSVEELARRKPPTPPMLADIVDTPDDAGDFSSTSVMRVLFRLMVARATGLLVVVIGGIKKEIYIRDGQPEYVSSNVASELFGNYLVAKGVLSDGELAMALAMVPHYGGKLGDTLVGLGLLKPLEVFRHLTRQVRTKIIDVCTWSKGQFAWYVGRENPREAFPLDFNAFEILGAGALGLSDEFADIWFAKNRSARFAASRGRRVGPERFEVKGLPELYAKLDGRHTVEELVEMSSDRGERAKVTRMLFLLDACEMVRVG